MSNIRRHKDNLNANINPETWP